MPKFIIAFRALAVASALTAAFGASAADETYVITLKNHAFVPEVLTVPAGRKVRVTIKNQDPTPAEFESNALNREKIVGANAEATIFIGPLKPGSYDFYDDFRKATTTGKIEVK